MTRYRRFVLGAVAWVVVVTLGATLVWTVISDAGAEVGGELPATTTATSGASSTTPSGDGTSATPGPTSGSAPAPGGPRRSSWRGAAGVVVGECRGQAVSLVGAQPASGWSIEVDKTGPEQLRVEFENGEGRVRVEARCVDGSPLFTTGDDD